MSRASEFVVAFQIILVAWAALLAFRAYRRGLHDWRPFHLAVAFLCLTYLSGFLYLLIVQPDRKAWSEVMVGVGFVTWPVVWMYPSYLSMKANKAVNRLRSKVAEYGSPDTILRSDHSTGSDGSP